STPPAPTYIYHLSLHDALPIFIQLFFLGVRPRENMAGKLFQPSAREKKCIFRIWRARKSHCRGASFGGLRTASVKRRITVSRGRSEEHTSELQSRSDLVCRLLL